MVEVPLVVGVGQHPRCVSGRRNDRWMVFLSYLSARSYSSASSGFGWTATLSRSLDRRSLVRSRDTTLRIGRLFSLAPQPLQRLEELRPGPGCGGPRRVRAHRQEIVGYVRFWSTVMCHSAIRQPSSMHTR